jgi:RNA polymerase sigma-70 factor (ECF subfamily)
VNPLARSLFREDRVEITHSWSVEASLRALLELDLPASGLDVRGVYLEHGGFLWRSLHGLGIDEADLEDAIQEVLWVVHRRAASFDPTRAKLTTWLYGICLRVARGQRRKRRDRPGDAGAGFLETADDQTPETELQRRDAERRLRALLQGLAAEKRAAFVMFELEGRSCDEIAELMGVPLGTVHSRIHAARAHFKRALAAERGSP